MRFFVAFVCAGWIGFGVSDGLACGGFFCNAVTPVNQAGERILFARDGEQIEMHVQINYQGPSVDFGWILPAAPDVETTVSTEALFARLNGQFRPRRLANYTYDPDCPRFFDEGAFDGGLQSGGSDASAPSPDPEPMVNVLSREAVGPYDRVILQADNTDVLFDWLNENEFAIPMDATERLEPYIDDHVFVAIKLLAGNESRDIKPLKLRYTGNQPTIPLRPTAVAAQPDMPIIVYVLGSARAVTLNYLHVELNETLINWMSGGTNYPLVAAHAIDQAGGRAFVTDYAGDSAIPEFIVDVADLEGLRAVRNLSQLLGYARILRSPDLIKLVRTVVVAPEGAEVDTVLQRPFDYDTDAIVVDGAALVAAIETQILPVYEGLNRLFSAHPKLTRLFTTMNAEEMTVDPLFDWNVDLPDVPNVRTAEIYVTCAPPDPNSMDVGFGSLETLYRITTPDGIEYMSGTAPTIARQDGATVRGMEAIGAAVVEQQMAAGQSEPEADNREMIATMNRMADDGSDDGPGCLCDASDTRLSPIFFVGVLGLLGLRRRFSGRRRGR